VLLVLAAAATEKTKQICRATEDNATAGATTILHDHETANETTTRVEDGLTAGRENCHGGSVGKKKTSTAGDDLVGCTGTATEVSPRTSYSIDSVRLGDSEGKWAPEKVTVCVAPSRLASGTKKLGVSSSDTRVLVWVKLPLETPGGPFFHDYIARCDVNSVAGALPRAITRLGLAPNGTMNVPTSVEDTSTLAANSASLLCNFFQKKNDKK